MNRMIGIVLFLLIAIAAIAGARFMSGSGPMTAYSDLPSQFKSNGERIYFTATSTSRTAIRPVGGGMHMSMMGGGCVTCHGADRQGGRMMPQFWKSVPPLTPSALFGNHDEGAKDDGHGGHDVYTDETLRRAITQGIDPGGKPLDQAMPRWSMSPKDLDDLITHLKSPAG
jgi:mono/diheme cytochrome c family protein